MQDVRFGMQDARYKMQDAGYKMQDAGSKLQDYTCIRYLVSGICKPTTIIPQRESPLAALALSEIHPASPGKIAEHF